MYASNSLSLIDTLSSARKRAASTDYTSSEEIGRGKRRKRVIEREPETSSSNEDDGNNFSRYIFENGNNYPINFVETGAPPPYLPLQLDNWEKT